MVLLVTEGERNSSLCLPPNFRTLLHSLPTATHFSSLLPSYPIRQHTCLTRLTDGAVLATNVESISLTLTDSVEWI